MRRPRGALLLLLHAHLPYVRHPEDEDHLEEGWLAEAVMECYLPLLAMLERLADDRVPVRLTLSVTATPQDKVTTQVQLPAGSRVEWVGEFGNLQDAIKRLSIVVPISLALIAVLLFFNFGSMVDT